MPPPRKGRQRIQDRLQRLLQRFAREHYVIHMEMAFRPTPEHEVWVADIGCVSMDRDDATAADDYPIGAPELVIAVLSPSNTADEINDKMFICMSNGCNSFWIVDPKRQLVSVTQGAVTTLHGHAEDVEQIPVRSSKLILQPAYGGSPRAARRVPTPGLINQVDREAAAQEERTHAPLGDAVSEFFYSSRRASIGCSRAARQAGP
jgi:Uma2 family endonuclease